jgi:L-aspartate oxidase
MKLDKVKTKKPNATVMDSADDFESHIKDTLSTGSHLGDEKAVRFMVENAPDCQ